jgi:signal peptidase I
VSTDFPTGFKTGAPTQVDLSPVAVGGKGAAVTYKRLKILRDIYYIALSSHDQGNYDARDRMKNEPQVDRTKLFTIPANFVYLSPGNLLPSHEFPLEKVGEGRNPKDQFFAMGDNSPQSQDSRLWWHHNDENPEYWVNRDLLIGKAMVIYWPHPWGGFWPNWSRMLKPVR